MDHGLEARLLRNAQAMYRICYVLVVEAVVSEDWSTALHWAGLADGWAKLCEGAGGPAPFTVLEERHA